MLILKVTKFPVMILRLNGIPISIYIDDLINFGEQKLESALDQVFVVHLLHLLGYTLSLGKV